ncbi:MAG: SdrD B-like domain-containing protein, partial [Pseudomonadota bacterium]
SEHLFCAYNDYRGANDPDVGDGWPGISQSRNAGSSWISRLAPGYPGYGDQDGDGASESVGRGFAADPVVAAAPGVMLHGFIASDRDPKGPGGLYLQRWFETNSEDENGFTWQPEADTLLVAPGEVGSFIDKPDIVFAMEGGSFSDGDPTTAVDATLEGGTLVSRDLPRGTIMMAYTVFNDPEESSRIQDLESPNYIDEATLDGVADMGGVFTAIESPELFTYSDPGDGVPPDMAFENPGFLPSGPRPRLLFPDVTADVQNLITEMSFSIRLDGGIPSRYEFDLGFATLIVGENEGGGFYTVRFGGTVMADGSFSSFITNDEGFDLPTGEWIPISVRARFLPEPYKSLSARQAPGSSSPIVVETTTGHFVNLGAFEDDELAGSFELVINGNPVGVLWYDEDDNLTDVSLPMFEAFPGNQLANATIPVPFPTLAVEIVPDGFGSVLRMRDLEIEGLARESEVFVTKSQDYGESWSRPQRLDGDSQNSSGVRLAHSAQAGTTMAIWRRFREELGDTGGDGVPNAVPSGMQSALSTDLGDTWRFQDGLIDRDSDDEICPFDQLAAADAFRTNAFPTLVADDTGRFYAFWSQRGFAQSDLGGPDCALGQSRLVYSLFDEGWSFEGVLDDAPELIGHQVMPHAARSGDRIMVAYWDSRNSEGLFDPFLIDSEDPANPGLFSRQTMELRALQLDTSGQVSDSVPVSQFLFGDLGDGELVPLEQNYVNLRLFQQGRTPFMGDYVSVSGQDYTVSAEALLQGAAPAGDQPFYFAWADNRDVRITQLSLDDEATPHAPEFVTIGEFTPSVPPMADEPSGKNGAAGDEGEPVVPFDLDELRACNSGDPDTPVLARDQNVYGAMYFPGLQISSPTPVKREGDILRAQIVYVRNFSDVAKTYRLTITEAGGNRASFSQFPLPPYDVGSEPPQLTLEIGVQPGSVAAHSVYIFSGTATPEPVSVAVQETGACESLPSVDCDEGALVLNADPSAPGFRNAGIANPGFRNPGFQNDPLQSESREPEFGEPIITANFAAPGFQNPGFRNPGFRNPGFQNPGFRNATIENVGIQNPGFQNPGFRNSALANPGFQNPGFQNPGFRNPGFQNPGFQNVAVPFNAIANPGFQNSALSGADTSNITDITWPVTNSGNTTSVFDLRPVARVPAAPGTTQLLVTRAQVKPTIRDCIYVGELRSQVIANIANPDLSGQYDPASQTGDRFGSVAVGPYETVFVTLRIFGPSDTQNFGLAAINQACDTNDPGCTADVSTRVRAFDAIGGQVSGVLWDDTDADGVRQDAEPFVSGAEVRLLDASGAILQSVTSDALGSYRFAPLPLDVEYRVVVPLPSGFGGFSPLGQGVDQERDSDFEGDGSSPLFSLTEDSPDVRADAGLVLTPVGPALEFCDDPVPNRFTDRGLFIWRDCLGSGELVVEMTGGGTRSLIRYQGRFESMNPFEQITRVSLESDDIIDSTVPGELSYEFKVYNVGLDAMRFRAADPVCFRPITPGGLPVFIGGARAPLTADSVQSDTGLPCALAMDRDGDGLTDEDELSIYGTDPDNADSDGGGVNDGTEVDNGTDPNDPNDDLDRGCGMPSYAPATDTGYFFGKRCNDPASPNRWELAVTGGGRRFVRYQGDITTTSGSAVVGPVSVEASDVLDSIPGDSVVDFNFGVSRSGSDGFIVDLPVDGEQCFTPTSAFPVFVGAAGVARTGPFNLVDLGPCEGAPPTPADDLACDAPVIDRSSEPGLYAWRSNCSAPAGTAPVWEVLAAGGGGPFRAYSGQIVAATPLVAVPRSIESSDTLDTVPGDGVIDHVLKVVGAGIDGYAVELPATGACFDAGPVFLGASKTLIAGAFNTADLGSCN